MLKSNYANPRLRTACSTKAGDLTAAIRTGISLSTCKSSKYITNKSDLVYHICQMYFHPQGPLTVNKGHRNFSGRSCKIFL